MDILNLIICTFVFVLGPLTNSTWAANQDNGQMIIDHTNNVLHYINKNTIPSIKVHLSASIDFSIYKNKPTVMLHWIDNSTNSSGFDIQRSLDGGNTWNVIAWNVNATVSNKVTNYMDNSVTDATSYLYRLSFGPSNYSNIAGIMTPMPGGTYPPKHNKAG